ncbi:hypothetical protein [Ornithinimicrobium kibberense]|uniref:hypothetical protein n=1 Tax=Ornithinimicrobium kibberense TaxID=282060 RepID=UPI003611059B
MDEPAPGVGREPGPEGHQALPVPVEDRLEGVDDDEVGHPVVLEHGPGGVAQAEPAHDDPQTLALEAGEGQPGQLLLGHGEQARHEVLLAELDLVDLRPGHRLPPSPEAELVDRGLRPRQLLEPCGHVRPLLVRSGAGAPSVRTTSRAVRRRCVWARARRARGPPAPRCRPGGPSPG